MTDAAFKIDHLGIAVPDIEQALSQYAEMFGYRLLRGPYDDPQQQARVAFIGNDSTSDPPLELVAPLGADSQVQRVLAKGLSLYHVCYEVPNVEKAIEHLNRSLDLAPEYAPARASLARAHLARTQWALADGDNHESTLKLWTALSDRAGSSSRPESESEQESSGS